MIYHVSKNFFQTSRRVLTWDKTPLIMGILNLTPDSFSDGGRYLDLKEAVDCAQELEHQGADILDLGGESTRPNAQPVSTKKELERVIPVIHEISQKIKIPISIDTTKAEVARQALEAGAEIVNDVSGGEWDPNLWKVVAEKKAGYVLMHCQGRPESGFGTPTYKNVVSEVLEYLRQRLALSEKAGIALENIVIDPGFGFGKTKEHNLALLAGLNQFQSLNRPLLVGLSRKSFLKTIGGEKNLDLTTLAAEVFAFSQGAAIWRVHDVEGAVAAVRLLKEI